MLCLNCVENQILDTAEPMIDLLIDLVKDGMEIPPYVVKKISNLALLAGAKISCESCGESLK